MVISLDVKEVKTTKVVYDLQQCCFYQFSESKSVTKNLI